MPGHDNRSPDSPQQPEHPVPEEAERQGVPLVGHIDRTQVVVQQTTRFSREFVATMISLATAAFGVVAALAWNSAITFLFSAWLKDKNAPHASALFLYAVVVTLIGVTVIVLLGRLATRINAEPVEFKYPGTPKKA